MRTIFLLCAVFSLSIAAVPVEEEAAAPEKHQGDEWPVQMLDRAGEEEPQPEEEVGEEMPGVVLKSGCPDRWSKFGTRCFIYIHREMSWVDAEKYCVGNGANVVSIHTPGEYQFIQEVVRGGTGRFSEAWIGGNDAVKDYVWLWSDGSVFNFHDWDVYEPDNNYNKEKCVVMNVGGYLLWGDANCELSRPFVCGTRPL